MAKKNNIVKENEELNKEVVPEVKVETSEKIEEVKEEVLTEDTKIEENASDKKQDAEVKTTEDVEKNPTVKEVFRDKYDEKVVYNLGDIFVVSNEVEDKKPVKIEKGKYKVSKERYEELKRSLYVD